MLGASLCVVDPTQGFSVGTVYAYITCVASEILSGGVRSAMTNLHATLS